MSFIFFGSGMSTYIHESFPSHPSDIMNNKVFYQHPNLMRVLGMHETVMEVMVNVLGGDKSQVKCLQTVEWALEPGLLQLSCGGAGLRKKYPLQLSVVFFDRLISHLNTFIKSFLMGKEPKSIQHLIHIKSQKHKCRCKGP